MRARKSCHFWPGLPPSHQVHGRDGPDGQNGHLRQLLIALEPEPLLPKHGGYRKLKRFQLAQLCYDVAVRFCDRYIDPKSRTHDQMVQAARSGVQNIAEGSQASGTSKKFELKLTNVGRASLEELRLDSEDFLRQRHLPLRPETDARRKALVARRCTTANAVAHWVREVHQLHGLNGSLKPSVRPMGSISSIKSTYPEIAANAALILIGVAFALLERQIEAQAAAFAEEGGFAERLHRIRTERKKQGCR
jgi:four helix bundle suffix protein